MTGRDYHCPECRDAGFVRDWYADTESGYRECDRPGCIVAEEIAAAVERDMQEQPCAHPRRQPATRLPAGCFTCPDCCSVFRMRTAS